MFYFLICSLLFIKTNVDFYKTDFFYDENEEQHLIIDVAGSFKSVKNAYFLLLINRKEDSGYVRIANFYNYTRTIRDKKEYDQFVKSKKYLLKSSKEYKDLENREFNTIFVDMKWIEKDLSVTFAFEIELKPYKKIVTRPFHFSENKQKWEMGYSEENK